MRWRPTAGRPYVILCCAPPPAQPCCATRRPPAPSCKRPTCFCSSAYEDVVNAVLWVQLCLAGSQHWVTRAMWKMRIIQLGSEGPQAALRHLGNSANTCSDHCLRPRDASSSLLCRPSLDFANGYLVMQAARKTISLHIIDLQVMHTMLR